MRFEVREIERRRSEIVDRALSRALLPERWTIYADLLANRVLDLLHDQAPPSAKAWLGALADDRLGSQDLFHVIPATVSAAIDVLTMHGALDEHGAETMAELQRQLDVGATLQRTVLRRGVPEAVDPVDAKIDQLMYELSNRDSITSEHSRAVSLWCLRVAHHMNLSEREALYASRGGAVHDVGKIYTPYEILAAPRRLNEDEWEIMKDHVREGERMIAGIPELREFTPVVRSHHERFDGKGYPDGRASSDLPLAVRIATVADAFNAMIARRPYRAPLTPDAALAELRRESGTHFDPNVVAAMIEVVQRTGGRFTGESSRVSQLPSEPGAA
ncbi:MAG: HD domain-containing protein [Candidatus Eremiobacteraeota bacterium]|nr:HD domain-containing protein [Candidatus Eremiobacteraeota bacterium]